MHKISHLNSQRANYSSKEEYIFIHNNKVNKKFKRSSHLIAKRNLPRIITLAAIVLILVGASSFTANRTGFLPIKILLETEEPIGHVEEIDIGEYIDEYPELDDIPRITRIKYQVYGTDASVNTVALDYKQKLQDDGYKLKYTGSRTIRGISVDYFGFVKGLTVVGIVMTSEDVGSLKNFDTVVLYTTGGLFAYKDVISMYGF